MTVTEPPPQDQSGRSLSPVGRILLFVGLPVLVLALLIGGAVAALPLLRGVPVDLSYGVPAGSSVNVDVPDADFDVRPGSDDQVSVAVTGWYTGQVPRLRVETVADETTVRGGCSRQWFTRCDLHIVLTLPAGSDLRLVATNGEVQARALTGGVDVRTTNGELQLRDLSGDVRAATTNGGIHATAASSERFSAQTTNGEVELDFTVAPLAVEAGSTNGGIVVRVPDDGAQYFLDATTTNGNVTDAVGSERTAERTITAKTTNGNVSVERSDTP